MQTKFKRHAKVRLLAAPDQEYVEYAPGKEGTEIKKGALGKVNVILSNGQYHVEVIDEKGETLAYAPMPEEFLEAVE